MEKNAKIYIAGHTGLVGSALLRNLQQRGYHNFVLKSSTELDLMRQAEVEAFFEKEKPEYVIDAAAKVGGIMANDTYRAQFIHENIMMQHNIIHSSHLYGVKKLLFLGSSCIYPKEAPQPMKEEYLLTGLMEPTNEPYAIAKIAGIKMCESYYRQYGSNYISVMPTNLYGPNDNYDLEKSHVLPALIRKMHLGKCLENNDWEAIATDFNKNSMAGLSGAAGKDQILEVLTGFGIILTKQKPPPVPRPPSPAPVSISLWGTGNIYREFMHVDDMADACVHIMENVEASTLYDELKQTHINIGTGIDLTIKELAYLIKDVVGFKGTLLWDSSKPDGIYKKQLDVSLLNSLDWKFTTAFEQGLKGVYEKYSG
ncbi:MAG: GDP-L-fucose synthase [Bacteroidota bacterium]